MCSDSINVVYLLSSSFNYDLIISGDAGPSFASDYGWAACTIDELSGSSHDIVVVDHRFQEPELRALKTLIETSSGTFVLRVCDPIWEHTRKHWWYRFVSDILDQPGVHVMLNYQPAEVTALFYARSRRTQFIYAPYVHRKEMEREIEWTTREHCMLLSGAQDRAIYPLRSMMARAAFWWLPLRSLCATLDHPGYPDIGQTPVHDIVGGKYIDLLAKFRFATVCSSRCRLELLKYREFAYAGVVPVGDMPATLLDCPVDAWVPWRRDFVTFTRSLRSMEDAEQRAVRFRAFMRERRDVAAMREWVTAQLARLL
jgi:hypothetical protein